MGTLYYIGCRDCRVKRDLDKFDIVRGEPAGSRADAMALAETIRSPAWAFRSALLVDFMAQHQKHDCTLFSEHDEELCDSLADETVDFWGTGAK